VPHTCISERGRGFTVSLVVAGGEGEEGADKAGETSESPMPWGLLVSQPYNPRLGHAPTCI
jgi:hypothetical protein